MIGFGSPLLFEASKTFEYRNKPNQKLYKFGNTIVTNSFGMRSEEPSPNKVKILKIGDSIINGGSQTDQEELSSTLLSKWLSKSCSSDVQVLNISAGSWGPDNAYNYLAEYGTFDAKFAVVVFSSHDATDVMGTKNPVGKIITVPEENYSSAISEVVQKYLFKKYIFKEEFNDPFPTFTKDNYPNRGFLDLIAYLREGNIPILFMLHPDKVEVEYGYYRQTGNDILALMDSVNVEVVQGLNILDQSCYRDNIHLNAKGQEKYAKALLPILNKKLDDLGL